MYLIKLCCIIYTKQPSSVEKSNKCGSDVGINSTDQINQLHVNKCVIRKNVIDMIEQYILFNIPPM